MGAHADGWLSFKLAESKINDDKFRSHTNYVVLPIDDIQAILAEDFTQPPCLIVSKFYGDILVDVAARDVVGLL